MPNEFTFHQKLAALGFNTYKEYLGSEHWKDFRKKFFRSKRAKHCACCPVRTIEVELHHCTYDRLGKELLKDVIPLCREHHELVHSLLDTRYGGDVMYTNRVISSLVPRRGKRGRRSKWDADGDDYGL